MAARSVSENSKAKRKQGFAAHPELINRSGRPLLPYSITEALRKLADLPYGKTKSTYCQTLAKKLWALAVKGDVRAATLILDRVDGSVRQQLELSTPESGIIIVEKADGSGTAN